MARPMDLVYFGSGAFGLPTLRALAEHHRLRAVITQPDRKAGRGGRLTPTPVGEFAAESLDAVPLLKPERVAEPDTVTQVRAFPADAWVVIAYGQKLPQGLLEGRHAMNLHASLLPRWRGAAPINAAIVAGDAETGNSVITLADRMDAGDVLGRSTRPVDPALTAGEHHDLLADDGAPLVLSVLERLAAGTLEPEPQDESLVTLAPKLSKADGYVDFSRPAPECRCRIHGLTPWPGVTVGHRGEPLKLLRVQDIDLAHQEEGGRIADAAAGLVACARGTALRVLEVQPAGKRPMPWADYANGRGVSSGERLDAGPPPAPGGAA